MHRTIRLAITIAVATLAALLLLACSGNESPPTESPTATETLSASPTPSSTPRRAPTPIITTVTPEQADSLTTSGSLIVVSGEVRSEHADGRSWPTIAVVTLNPAGDELARLEFGGVGRYPHGFDLVNDQVIVTFGTAIIRYRLDGTIATTLRPESDLRYQSVLLSPDGSRIVFAEFGDPDCGVSCVVFADATNGAELGRVSQIGTAISDFSRFAQPSALRGNNAVLVRGQPTATPLTASQQSTSTGPSKFIPPTQPERSPPAAIRSSVGLEPSRTTRTIQ